MDKQTSPKKLSSTDIQNLVDDNEKLNNGYHWWYSRIPG